MKAEGRNQGLFTNIYIMDSDEAESTGSNEAITAETQQLSMKIWMAQ